jgi:hypothetical protein
MYKGKFKVHIVGIVSLAVEGITVPELLGL